jgi:hypothetical protein
MSHAIAFDTLAYAKKLKSVGFTEEQAEVQAKALSDLINDQLTTKQDLKELELRLTVKVGAMLIALAMILFAGLPVLLR